MNLKTMSPFKIVRMIIIVAFIWFITCVNCIVLPMTCPLRKVFVDGHNFRRQVVAQNYLVRQPPASNMMYMSWDEELAEKAARWAEKGIFGHNPDKSIGSQRWKIIGENVYMSTYTSNMDVPVTPNIEEAMDAWFMEHLNYGFEPFTLETEKPIGHYTQMVWAETTHVGCGISQNKQYNTSHYITNTLFVCDYGPTGNYFDRRPYEVAQGKGYLRCGTDGCNKPYGNNC